MEQEKIRVFVLGSDLKLLSNVVSRINKTRPAELLLYTNLKSFLGDCMKENPDVICLSVNYPHPNIVRFPKIFSMTLNIPVIIFGEDHNSKTRQLINTAGAQMRISGVITAHNLWMKLIALQKKKQQGQQNQEEENVSVKNTRDSTTVMLKGEGEDQTIKKADLMSSLMSQLSGGEDEPIFKNRVIVSKENDDINPIKKGSDLVHLHSSGEDFEVESPGVSMWGAVEQDSSKQAKSQELMNQILGNFEESQGMSTPQEGAKEFNESTAESQAQDPGFYEPSTQSPLDISFDGPEFQFGEYNPESTLEDMSKDFDPTSRLAEEKNKPKKKKEGVKSGGPEAKDNVEELEPHFEEPTKKPEELAENKERPLNDNTDFGEVQVELAQELATENESRQQEKNEREENKARGLLEESCRRGLEDNLAVRDLEKERPFSASTLYIYTMDHEKFKGFILFANSFNHQESDNSLNLIRETIREFLKAKSVFATISMGYQVKGSDIMFADWARETCEFFFVKEDDAGKQYTMSFLPLEKISPKINKSEHDGMYEIDLQSIPTETKVNFNAYLYLPKNGRFVRYLKEGRSLGLNQVKRLMSDDTPQKLFLPESEKQKYIQFFIEHILSWEFDSYKKTTAA